MSVSLPGYSGPSLTASRHIYDRLGCDYNAPASYAAINGTFESCQGDPQRFPGEYGQGGTSALIEKVHPRPLTSVSSNDLLAAPRIARTYHHRPLHRCDPGVVLLHAILVGCDLCHPHRRARDLDPDRYKPLTRHRTGSAIVCPIESSFVIEERSGNPDVEFHDSQSDRIQFWCRHDSSGNSPRLGRRSARTRLVTASPDSFAQ